ncbi:hypothetical protein ACJX0J_022522, partial [Zea mays]
EVRFVLPDGVGKRGAVDAGRERGYMVEEVAGNCARQFWGCRLAAPTHAGAWPPVSPSASGDCGPQQPSIRGTPRKKIQLSAETINNFSSRTAQS